jgi:small subunit ribosomal protein S9
MEVTTKKKSTQAKKASFSPRKTPLAHGVGRRKSSVARVWLRQGNGNIMINGKDYSSYFDTEITKLDVIKPLKVLSTPIGFDFDVDVRGGGTYSQAGAARLGISRALVAHDEALRPILRHDGLLTVDSRLKERKKYGRKAARRRFQFVKR